MSAGAEKSRAVVLLSGGMDSATVLALALREHDECRALSFDYGQRNAAELNAARRVAESLGAHEHRIEPLGDYLFASSALVDSARTVPDAGGEDIPSTYVPARNLVFLSMALAWAESCGAGDIYIGVNAVDYSGYPDCRPRFVEAFERLAALATRTGVEGGRIRVRAPLLHMSKADIVKAGVAAGLDYALTVSCYRADDAGAACGACDACRLRRRGFVDAGVADPTRYA